MMDASFEETEVLRRGTSSPRLDFVVLPLTPATLPGIEKAIISRVSFTDHTEIVHVQIQSQDGIAFAAYDNFHEDCVVAYPAVPVAFLAQLVKEKVLPSYQPT